MSSYNSLYVELIHIFNCIDSISTIIQIKIDDIEKPCSNKVKLMWFEEWTQKTLIRFELFLRNDKFIIKTSCQCAFCNDVGFLNIQYGIDEISHGIDKTLSTLNELLQNNFGDCEKKIQTSTYLSMLDRFLRVISNNVKRESLFLNGDLLTVPMTYYPRL